MDWLRVIDRDGPDAVDVAAAGLRAPVAWTQDELWRMTCLTGTFVERKAAWKAMKGALSLNGKRVWLIGCGAQGTVLLYVLREVLADVGRFTVIDKREARREAFMDVTQWSMVPAEFVCAEVTESTYKSLLGALGAGDLVVDCSVGVDTVAMIELCMERGALFVNSAIEDWMPDGFYDPENDMEESMYYLHGRLHAIQAKTSSALVSMGCNPGSVSVWVKLGLEMLAARFMPLAKPKSYSAIARRVGVETIHVSESDTQVCAEPRPVGEYWNTWSSDSAAFYKEGVGPAETGWGSHESDSWVPGDFVEGGEDVWNFRVWRTPGLCMEAETVLPMAGRVRGMVVRHDESYTIAQTLSDSSVQYSPSVYYVY